MEGEAVGECRAGGEGRLLAADLAGKSLEHQLCLVYIEIAQRAGGSGERKREQGADFDVRIQEGLESGNRGTGAIA